MRKNINNIVVKPGWTKWISLNLLIIDQDKPFDLFEYATQPYITMPIYIEPTTQALQVDTDDYRQWYTQVSLGDVIEL